MKSNEFIEDFSANIIAMLEEKTAPWLKPWDGKQSMPYNFISGKRYNGLNAVSLLIRSMTQNWIDSRFLTFKQVNSLGLKVKAGSKGCPILFYSPVEKNNIIDGKPDFIAKIFYVFNGEQIEGMPAIEEKVYNWQPIEKGEEILHRSGARLIHMAGDKAFYSPSTDTITLPKKEQFKGAIEYYSTALHELSHWTGHESRLNRFESYGDKKEYAKEELRAEIASWLLAVETGIPNCPENNLAYIDSWVSILKEKPKEIKAACSDASKITEYILGLSA